MLPLPRYFFKYSHLQPLKTSLMSRAIGQALKHSTRPASSPVPKGCKRGTNIFKHGAGSQVHTRASCRTIRISACRLRVDNSPLASTLRSASRGSQSLSNSHLLGQPFHSTLVSRTGPFYSGEISCWKTEWLFYNKRGPTVLQVALRSSSFSTCFTFFLGLLMELRLVKTL